VEIELLRFIIPILITGIFSGLLAGLLGVGGGIIIIPVVFYILKNFNYSTDIIMRVAIASSLAVIFFTSISSMYSHYKLNNIDILIIKKWFSGVIAGSICGALFASFINGNMLVIFFVIIASFIAINMLLNINIVISKDLPKNFLLNNIISFLIGYFSVLIGIGGGSFTVPILSAFGKNIHRAVGTSACIGFFIALPGFITYILTGWLVADIPNYSIGYVNLPIVLSVASISILTAPLGAKLSSRINKRILKFFFAVFLLIICINLIIENFLYN